MTSSALDLVKGYFREISWTSCYNLVFGSRQFPFWSFVQIIWSCYVVERSTRVKPKSYGKIRLVLNWVLRLLLSFAVSFGSREAYAKFVDRPSPLSANRQLLIIFAVTFVLITLSPFDIVYKLVNVFGFLLAFLQACNQVRLFTLTLRGIKGFETYQLVPIAYGFSGLDIAIEGFFRPLIGGDETPLSNGALFYRGFLLTIAHRLLTHKNQFTPWIGTHEAKRALVELASVMGGCTALLVLNTALRNWGKQPKKQKKRKPRPQQPKLPTPPPSEELPTAADGDEERDDDQDCPPPSTIPMDQ
jgi:hypothetical protein